MTLSIVAAVATIIAAPATAVADPATVVAAPAAAEAQGDGISEQLNRALAAWGPSIVDVRAADELTAEQRDLLQVAVREYEAEGFRLYFVLTDPGPTFSLGDFTSELRQATECVFDCLYLTTTRGGMHSSSNWFRYQEVRAMARALQPEFDRAAIPAMVRYARLLMEEGRRRTRHRQRMLTVAVAALCGLAGVFARGSLRRRRAP